MAVANRLVAHNDVTALKGAFGNMGKIIGTMEAACDAFAAHVDVPPNAVQTLDSQIKGAIPLVPSNHVYDDNGQEVCDALTGFLISLVSAFECIIRLNNDFKSVGILPVFCFITENFAKDIMALINDIVSSTPVCYLIFDS
ncbi:uncharacterized protein EV420DRAFT_1643972 [Desarmillaria tabescens]|uniref:Uncharacterized protein n=1 Tax=Armillaria tabescens TaxID=1929756 RepID=A0AA39KAE7_ARMTA|nr:uncharacterized protein EV420DRAFT_1643972 [Desarmillaria tabescens]KAK0457223.1 hypothetical protein EV420DRAFT_1643972 [Desarmillaria tabescens]